VLDRLIRKEKAENLQYGTVMQVDVNNRRVMVSGRNDLQVWAGYEPVDFPNLLIGHTVAFATAVGSSFVVRQLSSVLPNAYELLVV
jgi:hypothetical protein